MTSTMLQLAPDLHLEWKRWGSNSRAPQILMLHEGLGSVSMWRDFPEHLSRATGLGVVAYSRQGHGMSSPLASADMDDVDYLHKEAARIGPLLDALDISSALLFGHSDGASIALIAATLFPHRVGGLFLEAPHVYVEPETVAAVRAVGALWDNGRLRNALGRHHRDPEPMFRRWHGLWTSKQFRDAFDLTTRLTSVRSRSLTVQGVDDSFATPRQLEDIEDLVPESQVVWLDNCGHEPHREAPERIGELAASLFTPA